MGEIKSVNWKPVITNPGIIFFGSVVVWIAQSEPMGSRLKDKEVMNSQKERIPGPVTVAQDKVASLFKQRMIMGLWKHNFAVPMPIKVFQELKGLCDRQGAIWALKTMEIIVYSFSGLLNSWIGRILR